MTHPAPPLDGDVQLLDDRDADSVAEADLLPWVPVVAHPARAALIVLAMGLAAFAVLRSGGAGDALGTLAWCLVASVGAGVAIIDARVQRLPFVITVPLAAVTLALVGVRAFTVGGGFVDFAWVMASTGIVFVVAASLVWFRKMAAGDVALLTALAPALTVAGPEVVLAGLVVFTGAVGFVVLIPALIRYWRTGVQHLAYGPILVLSTILAFVFHGAVQQFVAA